MKIELMERRLEGSKKQGDVIIDLEAELARLRKEEKRLLQDQQASSRLVEQLETENAQLKVAGAALGDSKRSKSNQSSMEMEMLTSPEESANNASDIPTVVLEGNLETSYLLEQVSIVKLLRMLLTQPLQIEALRGTVRFLRSENLFIRSQGIMREMQELPPLRPRIKQPLIPPTPPPGALASF